MLEQTLIKLTKIKYKDKILKATRFIKIISKINKQMQQKKSNKEHTRGSS